jgi:hypothetical protein
MLVEAMHSIQQATFSIQSNSKSTAIESDDSSANALINGITAHANTSTSSITAHANTSTDAEMANFSANELTPQSNANAKTTANESTDLHAEACNCNDNGSSCSHADTIQLANSGSNSASVIASNDGASRFQYWFFKVPYFCTSIAAKTTSLCKGDIVSIPKATKFLLRISCVIELLTPDGADGTSASSFDTNLRLRLDLLSVSEGDCLLSKQPLDLTSVSEGDCLLSNQALDLASVSEGDRLLSNQASSV